MKQHRDVQRVIACAMYALAGAVALAFTAYTADSSSSGDRAQQGKLDPKEPVKGESTDERQKIGTYIDAHSLLLYGFVQSDAQGVVTPSGQAERRE